MNDRAFENGIAYFLEAAGFPNPAGRPSGIPLSVRIATTVYDDGCPPMTEIIVHQFEGWREGRETLWRYAWSTTMIGDFTVAEVIAAFAGRLHADALRADELAGEDTGVGNG